MDYVTLFYQHFARSLKETYDLSSADLMLIRSELEKLHEWDAGDFIRIAADIGSSQAQEKIRSYRERGA